MRFPEFSGEWEYKSLGEIGESLIGLTYSPSDVVKEGGTIVFRSSNIQNGIIDYGDLVRVSKKIKDSIVTREGDLLICARNGSARLIGKNALLRKSDEGQTFGAFMMVFRSDDNRFVHQLLSTKAYSTQVSENLGARINQITTRNFAEYTFSMPRTPEEKEKLGVFLELINDRIETQSKIIEELKTLRSALRQRLLYKKDVIMRPLSDFTELRNGYAFKSNTYSDTGIYNIVTISNVTGERYINQVGCNKIDEIPFDIQSYQILHSGDILISMTGNVGRVSMCSDGNYLLNQRVGLLKLKTEYVGFAEYIFQCLRDISFTNAMKDKGQGAAQQNIGKGDIESFMIPWFIDVRYSSSVSQLLYKLDNIVLIEEQKLSDYSKMKTGFLSKMFI